MTDCTIGKELKQSTCRFVKECKRGYTRNDKFICRKTSRRVDQQIKEVSPRLQFPVIDSTMVSPPRRRQPRPTAGEYKDPSNYFRGTELENKSANRYEPPIYTRPIPRKHMHPIGRVQFENIEPSLRTTPPPKKKPGKLPIRMGALGSTLTRNSYNLALPLAEEIRKKRRQTIKDLKSKSINRNILHPQRKSRAKADPKPRKSRAKPWTGPGFAFNMNKNEYGPKATPFLKTRKSRAKSQLKMFEPNARI